MREHVALCIFDEGARATTPASITDRQTDRHRGREGKRERLPIEAWSKKERGLRGLGCEFRKLPFCSPQISEDLHAKAGGSCCCRMCARPRMCTTLTVVSAFFVIPHWGVLHSASLVQSNCFSCGHGVEDVRLGRGRCVATSLSSFLSDATLALLLQLVMVCLFDRRASVC